MGRRSTSFGTVRFGRKTVHEFLEDPNLRFGDDGEPIKTIEEELLDTGSWALLSIRIPGYSPFHVTRTNGRRRLGLGIFTLPTAYTVLIGILSIGGSGYYVKSYFENILFARAEDLACYENTLTILWTTILVLVIYTTYLRCSRIFYIKSNLTFWRRTVVMLEAVDRNGYKLSEKYLNQIWNRIFIMFIAYHLASLVRILFNAYNIYFYTFKSPCPTHLEIVATYLDFFISFLLCYHVGYSVWLRFYIEIFSMCFQLIHDDLDTLEKDSFITDENLVNMVDNASFDFTSIYKISSWEKRNSVKRKTRTSNGSSSIEQKIKKTLATYDLLEDHMRDFNSQFGVTLIFETFFIFLYVVTSGYCIESFFRYDFFYAVTQVIPVSIYSSAFFQLASESSILSGKASGTLKKLEKFFIPTERKQLQIMQMKVLSLIARVADNPPTISAAHFFNMNRHLVTSFIGTVTTYLIVLLQFRYTPPESCLSRGKCQSNETLICGKCEPTGG